MSERIIGYTLLGIGIIMIIITTFQIFSVFTGKATPIQVFKVEKTSAKTQPSTTDLLEKLQQGDISALLDSGSGSIPGLEVISPEAIYKMLNITVYYFLMMFLLNVGYKIASLGIQMVRPVKVEVINNKLASMMSQSEEQSS
ncbi:hypothetical protein IPM65_02635 [Candidatus Roizmanbacteria bacterium]|nr:MAG: hypothetical protein IPM65_02635 [Candidatus Roizmanbacteria bacterium]